MKRILPGLFLGLGLSLTAPLHAEMNHASMSHGAMDHTAMSGMQSEGVVRKVDKQQGKLTLRHGPLENLGMPAMTMVFRVTEPTWLDQIKPGDKVRFLAERVNGQLTVTQFEVVQ